MVGLGTIINVAGILAGGVIGHFFKKILNERHEATLTTTCGVATLFLGISGAMEGMLTVSGSSVVSGQALLVIVCLVLGALVGEIINIEDWFERFGEWLKHKSGNGRDNEFVDAFLTASFTVCIGAMAIVGSIEDGLTGDYSILLAKTVLDFIIVMVMTGSMGKGAVFSCIPVAILQGGVTALARVIEPLMTDAALFNLSMVGSILIFCVGLNLVWGKRVRVANLLPAIIFAVAAAFLPFRL